MNYEYFEKKNANVEENLIKEQGEDVCRNIINKKYISSQSKDYDFGFIHKTNVAQIGQTQSRNKKSTIRVSSFILCKLHPDFEEIDISLICSRPNSKDGKILIELVTQKAVDMKYKYLSLLSIGELKLVNWYKSQGFEIISEKAFPNGELKAYSMKKRIDNTKTFII